MATSRFYIRENTLMVKHENRFFSYLFYRSFCFYSKFKCEHWPHGMAYTVVAMFMGLNMLAILFFIENLLKICEIDAPDLESYPVLTIATITQLYNYRVYLRRSRYKEIHKGLFTKKKYQGRKGTVLIITYMTISLFLSIFMTEWGSYLNTGHW